MKTTITVLVDNIAANGLTGEWGLAIHIQYGEKRILVDTGASELFAENMAALDLNIEDIDYALLSHAHYDHGNGMPRFFKGNSKAPFYVRESTSENCYAKKFIFRKYIGIPKGVLQDYKDRIVPITGDFELCEGVYIIPHKTPGLEKIGKREMMYQKTSHGFVPDNFSHEQSLVLDTEKGLFIINSCSHGGAANIIREVMETFPEKKVYGLMGGFHLFNKSEKEIRDIAGKIRETGVELVCTGHCTKERAYHILEQELGERMKLMQTGLRFEI